MYVCSNTPSVGNAGKDNSKYLYSFFLSALPIQLQKYSMWNNISKLARFPYWCQAPVSPDLKGENALASFHYRYHALSSKHYLIVINAVLSDTHTGFIYRCICSTVINQFFQEYHINGNVIQFHD